MSTLLIRSATSQSSSYPIILTSLGGPQRGTTTNNNTSYSNNYSNNNNNNNNNIEKQPIEGQCLLVSRPLVRSLWLIQVISRCWPSRQFIHYEFYKKVIL